MLLRHQVDGHPVCRLGAARPEADLLRTVTAVKNKLFVDHADRCHRPDQGGHPAIVHPSIANRKTIFSIARTEHDGCARHKTFACHGNIISAAQLFFTHADEFKILPQTHADFFAVVVNHLAIGEDKSSLGMPVQFFFRTPQTVGMPEIILVRQRDQVAGAGQDGLFEILR